MKIGDIVPVPMYIGVSHNKPVHLPARVIQIFPKGHLGVMYLCETLKSHFRTCIVVPPPPRFQPDTGKDTLQRWSTGTHHNALEQEPDNSHSTYQKRVHERNHALEDKYIPMLNELGLDVSIKRSLKKLRSIAQFRGYDINEIEGK